MRGERERESTTDWCVIQHSEKNLHASCCRATTSSGDEYKVKVISANLSCLMRQSVSVTN